jgi:hypothetical protein
MENATRRIPCVLRLLEDRLSKERKDRVEWERNLRSDDPMVVRQARSNVESNRSRIEQYEAALEDLSPTPKQKEQETVKIE